MNHTEPDDAAEKNKVGRSWTTVSLGNILTIASVIFAVGGTYSQFSGLKDDIKELKASFQAAELQNNASIVGLKMDQEQMGKRLDTAEGAFKSTVDAALMGFRAASDEQSKRIDTNNIELKGAMDRILILETDIKNLREDVRDTKKGPKQ